MAGYTPDKAKEGNLFKNWPGLGGHLSGRETARAFDQSAV
jgi:hypothetical protein